MMLRSVISHTILSIAFLLSVSSCKKKDLEGSAEAEILSYNIASNNVQVDMAPLAKLIRIKFPESETQVQQMVADFTLSSGATARVDNQVQVSGTTANNFESDILYSITPENRSAAQVWTVSATNNDYTYDWGLGHILKQSVSHDKAYPWYIDQLFTGTWASVNCGPSSVTMAIKWADPGFTKVAEDARNAYRPAGGWWFNTDISAYLNDNSIPNATIALGNTAGMSWETIKRQLDFGRIMIIILDMDKVSHQPQGNSNARVGKFYNTTPAWGHIIVLKGYKDVDQVHYLQVYDPNSWGAIYQDNNNWPKGKDRYYSYTDIFNATLYWWNYGIVVSPKGTPIDPGTLRSSLRPAEIPLSPGR